MTLGASPLHGDAPGGAAAGLARCALGQPDRVRALAPARSRFPGLLGGRRLKMAATLIYDEYLHELNWPIGAAIAMIVLVANLAIMLAL